MRRPAAISATRRQVRELDDDAERAAVILRHVCGITSRAELDHKAAAAAIFHERIRKPWNAKSPRS